LQFLNFFFSRIRPNEEEPDDSQAASLSEEWTEEMDFTPAEAMAIGRAQGYHWLSPCQGEYNLVRAGDSPIVFRELNDKGEHPLCVEFYSAGPTSFSTQMT
jgi:hypothetical protein